MVRDLDKINPVYGRPNKFIPLAACLPLVISAIGMALASGAAESIDLFDNPIWVGCFFVMLCSIPMLVIPHIFKWGWRAEYYGIAALFASTIAVMGGVPWLCLVVYSSIPLMPRLALFCFYCCMVAYWGWRFVPMYRKIFEDSECFKKLYQEDGEAFYYLQKADRKLLRSKRSPREVPSALFVIVMSALAFGTLFFASTLTKAIGLPFTHIFLGIISIPIDMMAAGFMVRGCLIYFYFPWKIYLLTGKRVYVDMATAV